MATQPVEVTFTDVGTSWEGRLVSTPAKYQIHRAMAQIVDGTGTQVALRVAQKAELKHIKLEYSLSSKIDSIETQDRIMVYTKETDPKRNGNGYTYIQVKCDAGTDNEVFVLLDVEVEQ